MENLGRGVIAMRTASSTAYVGWRLLQNDPEGVGFNLYRSQNGGAAVKLNAQPITSTTDFVDATANLTVSNAWFVRTVTNGIEFASSAPFGVAANAAIPKDFQNKLGPYLSIPLQTPPGGGYYVHHVWPGDFDGDGEYDFTLTRLPDGSGANPNSLVEAYLRDGTLLWRMDMGPNSSTGADFPPSAVSEGHNDNVTAYDLDGDGLAEVLVRTARGVTVTNGAGSQVASVTAADDLTQYISVVDGLTGVIKAQAVLPNLVPSAGPMSCHFGIMYGDGIRPSLVVEALNRAANGTFYWSITCWDYRNGQLTNRWLWAPPAGNYSRAHQIRIADVDHDGKDEFCEINFVLHDDGDHATPLYHNELLHGDRYHIADLDPDRPGLETYAIQQNNPNLLATALFDSATGESLKQWYSAVVTDVGRGNAGDVDANTRGVELFSTQSGLWSCKGDLINNSPPYPNFSVWWDADLFREQLDDGKINKYGYGRLVSPYYMPGYKSGLPTWRSAQPLYGDLFGDWREEVLFESTDHSSLIIFTPVSPSTMRLVCLAQDPEYRECMTVKGYMQSTWPSYYLGVGMPAPPIAPVSDADLVWRGNSSSTWDAATANWFTNNLWISNTTPVAYSSGASVLFDLSGSNDTAITVAGTLTPGPMKVHTPTDYTFTGGTLAGGMTLTKAGAGKLTFNNTNSFTGRTLITEGPFIVNGSVPNSPVTVRGGVWLDGRLSGTGSVGAGVSLEFGGGVSPGNGMNAPGTLTIANGLTLQGGTLNEFDLSDDASGTIKTNDRLNVVGPLTLLGTNTLVITKLDGTLPPGAYPLITYSGTLSGGLNNLTVSGLTGIPIALTNPPGQIALVVKSFRDPATITWTGGSGGNTWDLLTSSNWLNGAVKDQFVPNDSVRFDNIGASNPTVNLSGDLNPADIVVDSTANYTFTGSGGISGSTGLTKTNSGTLTINALNNTFTGKTIVGGGMLVVPELDAVGFPSPLGNPPGGSANLALSGNATLRITGESFTDRGLTLNAGTNVIDVPSGSAQVSIGGVIVGAGALQKNGNGTLALNGLNSYSGGTIIKDGNVSLGGGGANQYALGTGPVTLDGGTLTMFSQTSSYDTIYWNLIVPAGSTGRLNTDARCNLYGSLTGGGTLDYSVSYVRTELDGNWSAFTGQLNVIAGDGSGDFRIGNSYGYGNAHVNLGSGISAYHLSGGGVAIGALSGSGTMSGAAWTVGNRNTDTTFSGNITGNSLTKVGTGTLMLTGNNSYAGTTTINGGTLRVNGNNSSATGTVTVNSSGTLAGTGTVGGTVVVHGKLAPGNNSIGTLTLNGNLTLNGSSTTLIEVNRNTGAKDLADVTGALSYGGTLVVSNLAGTFVSGNSYKIFDAASYTGTFANVILPPLNSGLAWDTSSLDTTGVISVVVAPPPVSPVISSVGLIEGNLVFRGSNATAGATYYVLSSTNLAVPVSNWARLTTNQFPPGGNFAFTNAVDAEQTEQFFMIQLP